MDFSLHLSEISEFSKAEVCNAHLHDRVFPTFCGRQSQSGGSLEPAPITAKRRLGEGRQLKFNILKTEVESKFY